VGRGAVGVRLCSLLAIERAGRGPVCCISALQTTTTVCSTLDCRKSALPLCCPQLLAWAAGPAAAAAAAACSLPMCALGAAALACTSGCSACTTWMPAASSCCTPLQLATKWGGSLSAMTTLLTRGAAARMWEQQLCAPERRLEQGSMVLYSVAPTAAAAAAAAAAAGPEEAEAEEEAAA
jgi:hypothetical protein